MTAAEVDERAPLLGQQRLTSSTTNADKPNEFTPTSAASNDTHSPDEDLQNPQSSSSPSRPDEGGKARQYEGLPEVRKRMNVIFPSLAVGVFLAAADQTIIISTYGKIGSQLDALNKTSWIATAYFLTLTCFQPLYGKLSDIFSRKSCLMFGYIVFGIGCLLCGFAQDINQLIVARAIAGVGGGGITTVVSILLSDVIPLRERGTWQGYINIIYAAGAGAGAPLGGAFADISPYGWRWSFLFQLPLCVIASGAVWFALEMPEKDKSNWKERLRRIDFVGALTLITGLLGVIIALDRGSNVSWCDRITVACIVTGLAFLALFVFVEVKVAAEPFAPGRIIFDRSLMACYICNFSAFAGWNATLFYTPLYFQAVKGYTAQHSALLLLPNVVAGVSGSLFGGYTMRKTGKYYWLTVITYSNLLIGLVWVLLSTTFVGNDVAVLSGLVLCGFSNGIGVTSSLIALISNAEHKDQALATACSYLFRSLGNTVGLSLTSTIANLVLRGSLKSNLEGADAERIERGVRRSLDFIKTLSPRVQETVRASYRESTTGAFALDICLVLGAALAAWIIKEKPLSARH